MSKLDRDKLNEIREKGRHAFDIRLGNVPVTPDGEKHLMICGGTACHATHSREVKKALIQEIEDRGISGRVKIIETGCNGFCAQGPVMTVYPDGVFMSSYSQKI